jgi:hypothetical protein
LAKKTFLCQMKRLILIAIPICLFIILSCQKEYSVETGSNSLSAGTLKDSLGDCQPILINGTYTENQSLTAANFVNVTVNVSSAGKYKISTDTMNGFWFIDSGFFSSPGTYVVKLLGGGKPILAIQTDFTVSYGPSSCDFSITPNAASSGSLNSADTAWMFDEGTSHFHGHVDSALVKTSSVPVYLTIYGKTPSSDTTFYVQLLLSSTTPTGTYSTSAGTAVFEFKTPAGNTIYDARQTNSTNLVFTVTNFNTTTKVLDAIFSGTVKDASSLNKNVTSGKLKVQVQ